MILYIRHLKKSSYEDTYAAMRRFTDLRNDDTVDEVWLTEHASVFTQGLAGKPEHILASHDIPVVQTDRGGQVTYHGPGQLIFYVLINLTRQQKTIRDLVSALENATITLLAEYQISAQVKPNAPGVYVGDTKIASIGLRLRKGCTYHGLSLNVDMDLKPFDWINPCGFAQLKMTHMKQCISKKNSVNMLEISRGLCQHFAAKMQYIQMIDQHTHG